MIDGSLITQLPDALGFESEIHHACHHNWEWTFHNISWEVWLWQVMDYYNSRQMKFNNLLTKIEAAGRNNIGISYHTGKLTRIPREATGGNPALPSPTPKHVFDWNRDEDGNVTIDLFCKNKTQESLFEKLRDWLYLLQLFEEGSESPKGTQTFFFNSFQKKFDNIIKQLNSKI